MIIKKADKYRYSFELGFWKLIDIYNARTDEDIITTSEARGLRRQVEQQFNIWKQDRSHFLLTPDEQKNYSDLRNLPQAEPALRRKADRLIKADALSRADEDYRDYALRFEAVSAIMPQRSDFFRNEIGNKYQQTGYQIASAREFLFVCGLLKQERLDWGEITSVMNRNVSESHNPNAFLPVSPYDPAFAYCENVLNNGSSLSGILNKQQVYSDLHTRTPYQLYTDGISVCKISKDENGALYIKAEQKKTGLITEADLYGISRLRPYMTKEEYDRCKSAMAMESNPFMNALTKAASASKMLSNPQQDEFCRMAIEREVGNRNLMAKRSAKILEHLDDKGFTYRIDNDSNLGQIRAVLNTGEEIRLLDNSAYIGRLVSDIEAMSSQPNYVPKFDAVMMSNNNLQYSGRVYDPSTNAQSYVSSTDTYGAKTAATGVPPFNAIMANIDYSLGIPTQNPGFDGVILGQNLTGRSRNRSFNTTFANDKEASVSLGNIAALDLRDRYAFEEIIKDYQAHQNDPDWNYTNFSDDPRVRAVQKSKADFLKARMSRPSALMLRPGVSSAAFRLMKTDEERRNAVYPAAMSPEETVRQYMRDMASGQKSAASSADYLIRQDRDTNKRREKAINDPGLFIQRLIMDAKRNYWDEMRPDYLISEFEEHKDDSEWRFDEYSENPNVRKVQQSWMKLLQDEAQGRKSYLILPEYDSAQFKEADALSQQAMVYDNSRGAAQTILEDARNRMERDIGDYNGTDESKIYPSMISSYCNPSQSQYENSLDLLRAARTAGLTKEMVQEHDDYETRNFISHLIRFNQNNDAIPMRLKQEPFMQNCYAAIRQTLISGGMAFNENDILIDSRGIVQYSGTIARKKAKDGTDQQHVTGQIGQIFAPERNGVVRTDFDGFDNYAFVPGYKAHLIAQKDGEHKTMMERTRLMGYEQSMIRNIRNELRKNIMSYADHSEQIIGSADSLNGLYRSLYDERYPLDFEARYKACGMSRSDLDLIIAQQASRIRYDKDMAEKAGRYQAHIYEGVEDKADSNFRSGFNLTDHHNIAVLGDECFGYVDPIATTVTSRNQGCVRYLVKGATVSQDGSINPVYDDHGNLDQNAKSPLFDSDSMAFSQFDPPDRQNMALSVYMQAQNVDHNVKMALMTLEGWNMDDAMVVSRSFARKNRIFSSDGEMRELKKGDKISDTHGNKGVISIVVDPDMSEEEAKKQNIWNLVQIFRNNPELDVVASPFSSVSRYNAGTEREMCRETLDLKGADGSVTRGGIGTLTMIITDKTADEKTHIYDDEDIMEGKGRKASSQLAWAMTSKECDAIMREFYGHNDAPLTNLREYMIATGLDLSETAQIKRGYHPHQGETRRLIGASDGHNAVATREDDRIFNKNGLPRFNNQAIRDEITGLLNQKGGMMELPFEITMPTGIVISPVLEDGTVAVEPEDLERETGKWALPVLSNFLRSGTTFEDGTIIAHNYTKSYRNIYEAATKFTVLKEQKESWRDPANPERCAWLESARQAKTRRVMSDEQRMNALFARIDEEMALLHNRAQKEYDSIARDIISRKFKGKHNIFKEGIMARRLESSATSVWTPDPRLDIDQIAISSKMAGTLGIKEGEPLMIWRDPIIRDSCVRAMYATIDDSLTGVAINPVMDKCFEGDFDGDTVAVVKLHSPKAIAQLEEKFSVASNLLDPSCRDENGLRDLNIQESLDIKVAEYLDPAIKEGFADIKKRANETFGKTDPKSIAANKEMVRELSNLYRKSFSLTTGQAIIRHDVLEKHLESVYHACIRTGAKGNSAKFAAYAQYLGVVNLGEDEIKNESFKGVSLAKNTLASVDLKRGVLTATDVKNTVVGQSGAIVQNMMALGRNKCALEVLELTHGVTQSILQIKHSPEEAVVKYGLLQDPLKALWDGKRITYNAKSGQYAAMKGSDGKKVCATKEQWIADFKKIYSDKEKGLGVPFDEDYVQTFADKFSNPDGMMISMSDAAMKAPLDRAAYAAGCTVDGKKADVFKMMMAMADKEESLFDGTPGMGKDEKNYNLLFAPNKVIKNMKAKALCAAGKMEEKLKLNTFQKAGTSLAVSQGGADYVISDKNMKTFGSMDQEDDLFASLEPEMAW